jgi:hypothetical protein
MPIIVAHNDKVAAGAHGNLACDMAGKYELAVTPLDLDLLTKSVTIIQKE